MHTPGVVVSGLRRADEHGHIETALRVRLQHDLRAHASQVEDGRLVLLLAQRALLRREPAIARVLLARAAELGTDGADGTAELRRRAGWIQAFMHAADQWRRRLSCRHPSRPFVVRALNFAQCASLLLAPK